MEKKSVYTVYKTTNKENGKFYIGVHKTKNPNDYYLGSGVGIKRAIEKYGRESFHKEVLFIFESEEEAYQKEKEIVTEEFVKNKGNYNGTLGGVGGFSHIPPRFGDDSPMRNPEIVERARAKLKETRRRDKERLDEISKRNLALAKNSHSEETNRKRALTCKGRIVSDSQKEHMSKVMTNIYRDPEYKKKHSESLKRSYTDERLDRWSKRIMGEKNPRFCGYYHTPKGKFASLTEAYKAHGISQSGLVNRCKYKNDKVVTKSSVISSKDMDIEKHSHYIGKTWKELGWWFEPIEKQP